MATFAVIDGTNVLNTILADSKEIAEQVTGKTCVAYTTEPAEPGGQYIDGQFIKAKPFSSWVLTNGEWKPPIPYPDTVDEKGYVWDESTVSWVELS